MSRGGFTIINRAGLLLACMVGFLPAAYGVPDKVLFLPPAEGPVPFRRDKIPLDIPVISALSGDLVSIARGTSRDNPANRRGTAQMLALAMVLDPGNSGARDMLVQLMKGEEVHRPDNLSAVEARDAIWDKVSWLEFDAAGADGQALAACLKDVLEVSSPEDPKVAALKGKEELGAWGKWIPPLASYDESPPPDPMAGDPGGDPQVATSGPKLREASIYTVMWKKVSNSEDAPISPGSWELVAAPLEMVSQTTWDGGSSKPFSVSFDSDTAGVLGNLTRDILANVKDLNPPSGFRVDLRGYHLEASLPSGKPQAISAAATVLVRSALTGNEPRGVILGVIDANGAYKLPTATAGINFWDYLRATADTPESRLIVPAEGAEFLLSLLAMEKPEFFLKHEVLVAKNLQELVEFSAKTPSGALAGISSRFQEIRDKSAGQAIGAYLANPFIRRRLAEIAQEMPAHASARMLAIQGAGSRPTKVSRAVLISEVRRAIEPMSWIRSWQPINSSGTPDLAAAPQLAPSYEACRSRLDALKRYAATEDLPILDKMEETVTLIRPLDRAARSKSSELTAAHVKFLNSYEVSTSELRRISGDPPSAKQ